MHRLPDVSPESLKAFLHGQVDELAERMMASMNQARPGQLIDDSEEAVRQAGREFLQAAYQAAVQQKIDAAEASFSPSADHHDRSGDEAAGEETAAE